MSCPRCQGFLLTQFRETRCLLCAWYLNVPVNPPIPSEPSPNRTWIPDACEFCGKPALRTKSLCRTCYLKEKSHGDRVRLGMAAQKE